MNPVAFSETQYFRRRWVFAALLALNGLFIFAIIQQVFLGKAFGSKPAPDAVLFLIEAFLLLFLLFIFSIRLKIVIDDKGICYRYYPFQFKTTSIEWSELKDVYMRSYNSFYEYGGWGIRVGAPKTGRAINTSQSCNIGLQLEFMDGRRLLIGTRRPAAIEAIIADMITAGKIKRHV